MPDYLTAMGVSAAGSGNSVNDVVLVPVFWMFLAVLVTFVVARIVTRRIRAKAAGGDGSGLVNDITILGVHIHHQVFGILIMVGAGTFLIALTPQATALNVLAALFGVGVGLVFDEFALWVHMRDVYWANEGRQSIDAMFCVLAITGIFIGGTDLITGKLGTAAWWTSIVGLLIILALSVICVLKGKLITGIVGIVIQPIAIIGAIRLGKPESWWARRRYPKQPRRLARSQRRFGPRYEARWNRVRDLIAGAPTGSAQSSARPDAEAIDREAEQPPGR